jgi:CRISPR system Cascade subunit CasA
VVGFSYNLVEERWLPCLTVEGEVRQASLREALIEAHRLREIQHPSPLVTASLHRLLLAVIHRALGPGGPASWQGIWEAGSFPGRALDEYLAAWRHRFGLFDDAHPFYQVAGLAGGARPAQIMLQELASGNNATLFDHTVDRVAVALSPAQAACYLVALHSYHFGGTITRLPGEGRSAEAAPLMKSVVALLHSDTLFATLLLNWYRRAAPGPARAREDRPAWERDLPTSAGARMPDGYADLLTWQSRRVRLVPGAAGVETVVPSAVVMRGESFPHGFREEDNERMVAYRKVPKARSDERPWQPIGLDRERAMWRDATVFLVRDPRAPSRPPWTIEWVAELVEENALDSGFTPPLDLVGMVSHQAKILLWRRERMPLPLQYLADARLVDTLQGALDRTEAVGRHLRQSLHRLGEELAKPVRDAARPVRPSELDAVRGLEERGCRSFWSDLEWEFKVLMTTLPADRQEVDGAVRYGMTEVARWYEVLRRTARHAFEEQTSGLELSRRALRATALAQRELASRLSRELLIEGVSNATTTA